MLTVFANMRINDDERLQHLKDSFMSFHAISDDWLINIRGTKREEALAFLREHLKDEMTEFTLLHDARGWVANARDMLPSAKYEYVLLWNEDHYNIAAPSLYKTIVTEMTLKKADHLVTSWWKFGDLRKGFDALDLWKGAAVDTVILTADAWRRVRQAGNDHYLVSITGIFRKEFFHTLLAKDAWKLPMFFTRNLYRFFTALQYMGLRFDQKIWFHRVNGWLGHVLPRFSQETPFNLEKAPDRTDMLPLTLALPKQELFACIDDEGSIEAYPLIRRGLYPPEPLSQHEEITKEHPWGAEAFLENNVAYVVRRLSLRKGGVLHEQYWQLGQRVPLLHTTVTILSGVVQVETRGKVHTLVEGRSVTLYPNIGYRITAVEDAELLAIGESLQNRKIRYIE